ncbi:hypothetical protein Q5752_006266 [Cryptotrichosporon argae]
MDRSHSDASERTVLNGDERSYGATDNDAPVKAVVRTPLDMKQIAVLSLARVAEPLTFTILFPFVNQMILDTGQVEVEDVGYAVGLVETSFSLTQVVFLIFWSRAADSWGRKPVLLASLFGAMLASVIFGFSSRMWQMYAARCLAGIFGGNASVIRTLFAENSDRTNQAKAFGYFSFAANIGSLVGPMMGGFLAQPAKEYPRLFGHSRLLTAYPYALPCLIAALYVLVTMVLCMVYLREPPRAKTDHAMTVREALRDPMPRMLLIYGVTVSAAFSLSALLPTHLFTPIGLGGQSMRPAQIAAVTAAAALAQSLWLLAIMPALDLRLGTRRLFTWTAAWYPLVMAIPVLASVAARSGSMRWSYALLGSYVTLGSGTTMTFTSVQLLVNSTTPPAALSLINGIAQMIAATVKSIFPALINAVYAYGISHQVLHGYLAWLAMALMASAVMVGSWCAPEEPKIVLVEAEDEA